GVGDAGLAQEVDGEGDALLPEVAEGGQGVGGVGAGDEVAGHAFDLRGDGLGQQSLGDAARLQAQVHAGRGLDAGLGQVVDEVVVDEVGGGQGGEGVHEAEELDLEVFVLHGPVHQLVLVKPGA